MINFIDKFLCYFESCFSRKATFRWFVTITVGLMLRSDKLGVTSVIRDLALRPDCYLSMLHFFRAWASSWSLEEIRQRWFSAVRAYAPLYKEGDFHVLVGDAHRASKVFGNCLLLLDRYFLTVPALEKLNGLNHNAATHMEIITNAKKSCTAFEKPAPRKPGRGRPSKKGETIHLKELFLSHKKLFQETKMELYGKQETIRYYGIDLLWGQNCIRNSVRNDWEDIRSTNGIDEACKYMVVSDWYNELKGDDKKSAKKLFGKINQLTVEKKEKKELFKHGVLAFESFKLKNELSQLEKISAENIAAFIEVAGHLDDIEATMYYQIVQERLAIIKKMQDVVSDGSLDIRYKKASNKHLIIELKKGDRTVKSQEITAQVYKYFFATKKVMATLNQPEPFEIIVLLGKHLDGKNYDEDVYQATKEALKAYHCRIMYYDELLRNALNLYSDFLEQNKNLSTLSDIINELEIG